MAAQQVDFTYKDSHSAISSSAPESVTSNLSEQAVIWPPRVADLKIAFANARLCVADLKSWS